MHVFTAWSDDPIVGLVGSISRGGKGDNACWQSYHAASFGLVWHGYCIGYGA